MRMQMASGAVAHVMASSVIDKYSTCELISNNVNDLFTYAKDDTAFKNLFKFTLEKCLASLEPCGVWQVDSALNWVKVHALVN